MIAGNFGVRAQAKAAAPRVMRTMTELAAKAPRDTDKIKAGQTVLQVAGEMVQQHEHHHVHRILKDLTDAELVVLRDRGVWPVRYQTLVAKLGIGTGSTSGIDNGLPHRTQD